MPARSDSPFLRDEKRKYQDAWANQDYAKYSPGEQYMELFPAQPPGTLVDIGCGSGRAGMKLLDKGFDVTLLDITPKGLSATARKMPFIEASLWEDWGETRFEFGYCCDVMEHLPTEFVLLALDNIARHCNEVFFSICLREDHFGAVIGHPLHLTVRPFVWWRDHLRTLGDLVDARDFISDAVFHLRSKYAVQLPPARDPRIAAPNIAESVA